MDVYNNMKLYVGVICVLLLTTSCYSHVDKSLLENWNSYSIPTNGDTLVKYSTSLNEWSVFVKESKVHVLKKEKTQLPFEIAAAPKEKWKFNGDIAFVKVDNGHLVGFNRGEWGGYLYWFSKDGKENYQISEDRIKQFLQSNAQIYAIQGLAHLNISEGSIVTIEKIKGKWAAKHFCELPTAPETFVFDNKHNLIVITDKSLLKVSASGKITILLERGFWYDWLNSNSLVIANNVAYAGMTAGVYSYNLLTGKQEWLLNY